MRTGITANDGDTRSGEGKLQDAGATPHLSHSRIQKYLTCPEQYWLYYVEKLRAKIENANLAFGSVIHFALAEYFRRKADAVATFKREWQALRDIELRYSRKQSWQGLNEKGVRLLETFCRYEAEKISKVISVETAFEFSLSNLSAPFIGTIDLIAEIEGKRTIVEFKTSVTDYEDHEVAMMDQLSAYTLAEPDAGQLAVCVLTKTATPQIEWHKTHRAPEQVLEYLEKVEIVVGQIDQQIFYKRPGKWCRQCEFLPVCLGDSQKANETLVQIV